MKCLMLVPVCEKEYTRKLLAGDLRLQHMLEDIREVMGSVSTIAPNVYTEFYDALAVLPKAYLNVLSPTIEYENLSIQSNSCTEDLQSSEVEPPWTPRKKDESMVDWVERVRQEGVDYISTCLLKEMPRYKIIIGILGSKGMNLITPANLPKPQMGDATLYLFYDLTNYEFKGYFSGMPVEKEQLSTIIEVLRR